LIARGRGCHLVAVDVIRTISEAAPAQRRPHAVQSPRNRGIRLSSGNADDGASLPTLTRQLDGHHRRPWLWPSFGHAWPRCRGRRPDCTARQRARFASRLEAMRADAVTSITGDLHKRQRAADVQRRGDRPREASPTAGQPTLADSKIPRQRSGGVRVIYDARHEALRLSIRCTRHGYHAGTALSVGGDRAQAAVPASASRSDNL